MTLTCFEQQLETALPGLTVCKPKAVKQRSLGMTSLKSMLNLALVPQSARLVKYSVPLKHIQCQECREGIRSFKQRNVENLAVNSPFQGPRSAALLPLTSPGDRRHMWTPSVGQRYSNNRTARPCGCTRYNPEEKNELLWKLADKWAIFRHIADEQGNP